MLNRYSHNPILLPNVKHEWENFAVFNGSVIKKEGKYALLYRAMGSEMTISQRKLRLSTIGKAESENGVDFVNRVQFIKPEFHWEKYGCEDPRVTFIDGKYYVFYTAIANYPTSPMGIRVAVAISDDLETIKEKHLVTPFNAKAMSLFPEKINGLYTVLLTVNTDNPPSHTAIAQFEKIETLWNMDFWKKWYENFEDHKVRLRRVNSDQVEAGSQPIKLDKGWLVIYSYIKHYLSNNVKKEFRIEGVLLDLDDPKKIIGRIEEPLLKPEAPYEREGQMQDIVFPEGGIIEDDVLKVYYGAADTACAMASIKMPDLMKKIELNSASTLKCKKFPNNPLLEPIEKHSWENLSVCNPAAIELEGKVYIMYRAISKQNVSNFGLAISYDGLYIDERLPEPIYPFRTEFEKPIGRDSSYGVEDARLTLIGSTLYLCYTAYDGSLPRLAFSSIEVAQFLSRQWEKWKMPIIISPPGTADKDGALFPETIHDSFFFFHRIEPDIVIDNVKDIDFKEKKYLGIKSSITPRSGYWDAAKVGINTPPLRTEKGWLIFYHGISKIDRNYRIGAMLLDLEDPTKVLGRTLYPILEPEAQFEREGVVDNVVFPCGFVKKGEDIYLYYGGGDRVVCGATVNLEMLLEYIIKSGTEKYLS